METDFIQEATSIVEKLIALDVRRVVFGATRHAYQFHEPLTIKRVEKFERDHKVSLPQPYRRFITELGNGGVGPYYGIMPLSLKAPHLLKSFPYAKLQDNEKAVPPPAAIPGAIPIAEYRCAIYIILVVRGGPKGRCGWTHGMIRALFPSRDPNQSP